jgi:hypothetical protein
MQKAVKHRFQLTEKLRLAPLGRNKLDGVNCHRAGREFGHVGLELVVPQRTDLSEGVVAQQGLTPVKTKANEC